MLRVISFLYFITFTTFYVQYNDFSQVVSGNIFIACDDECDGDGDNDHKAQSTRGPCCDNRGVAVEHLTKYFWWQLTKYSALPVKNTVGCP